MARREWTLSHSPVGFPLSTSLTCIRWPFIFTLMQKVCYPRVHVMGNSCLKIFNIIFSFHTVAEAWEKSKKTARISFSLGMLSLCSMWGKLSSVLLCCLHHVCVWESKGILFKKPEVFYLQAFLSIFPHNWKGLWVCNVFFVLPRSLVLKDFSLFPASG